MGPISPGKSEIIAVWYINYMTENEAAYHFLQLTHPFYGRKCSLKIKEDFTKEETTDKRKGMK